MHLSQMHSFIQYPNMYSSIVIQLNQSNIPVIMHPDNVFILQHLKMILIFIWPCHMQSQLCRYATLEFHKLGIYPEQIAGFIKSFKYCITLK